MAELACMSCQVTVGIVMGVIRAEFCARSVIICNGVDTDKESLTGANMDRICFSIYQILSK